ncbi:unannotated protein [freshwater metagenome]|uniref:Unannotated protein n=2 Tax=freshwater metagenome TaxID=449393 RepID=A0A6J7HI29_9ZZZZ|nr:hypothetical protein [Actinomycetota bacterium]MSW62705.1 hypothetical protein [Actinomycetota bacterium]MSX89728.1 hypothetical protein [Actinomycetota bacterium]
MNFKKAAVVANLALIVGLITPLTPVAYASSSAPTSATVSAQSPAGSASIVTPYTIPNGHLNITLEDLKFLLDQIKMGEAHAARTTAGGASGSPAITYGTPGGLVFPYDVSSADRCLLATDIAAAATTAFGPTGLSNNYTYANTAPWGIRQVDGQCNNITNVIAETPGAGNGADPVVPQPTINTADTGIWGAADQLFARLSAKATGLDDANSTQVAYANGSNDVTDPQPRIISTLISDQSTNNPAAIAAATETAGILYGTGPLSETAINAQTGVPATVLQIPNVTPDFNVSAGYNSWFTLFGQFFDHGLDLIPKAGASVLIPLQEDDLLYVPSGNTNFMVLTRGTDATGEASNITTPYVDQSQTYGSHQSSNFFLREYTFAPTTGVPTFTGHLLTGTDGAYGGGVNPTIAPTTKFDSTLDVIHPATGPAYKPALPITWTVGTTSGTLTAPGGVDQSNHGLATWKEIKAQAYLLGIALTDWDVRSIPVIATNQYGKFIPAPAAAGAAQGFPMMLFSDHAGNFMWLSGTPSAPIATTIHTGAAPSITTWYAVSSGHPFINDTMSAAVPWAAAGLLPDADSVMNGALSYNPSSSYYDNENLDAHYVAGDGRVNENIGLSAIHYTFLAEHNSLVTDITKVIGTSPSPLFQSEWTPERIYQAARWINEMEYMHLAFDEFVRRMSIGLPVFAGYDPTVNAAINQEFASAVYRLGHSMLNETIARSNPNQPYDPANNQDVSLITGFINPAQARLQRPAVIASADAIASSHSITYTVAGSEISPADGSVVTVTGMVNHALNVTSGLVSGHTATQFTVATHYVSGATASDTPITVAADVTGALPIKDSNNVSVATVVVNDPGTAYTYTPAESAAAIAQGMTAQRGNEIDEFVTDAVRNNLLGLPLDLASLNLTRGRDTMLPTLNQFRKANAAGFPPYTSWATYVNGLRYKASGVNFIAAYGTHPDLKSVTLAPITGASYDAGTANITYTYTGTPTLVVGQIVSISGFVAPDTDYNVANAVIASVPSAGTFTVHDRKTYGTQDTYMSGTNSTIAVPVIAAPVATGSTTGPASLTRETNLVEKRAVASILASVAPATITAATYTFDGGLTKGIYTYTAVNNFVAGEAVTVSSSTAACFNKSGIASDVTSTSFTLKIAEVVSALCTGYTSGGVATVTGAGTSGLSVPSDATDFYNSTGVWAGVETGFNRVDLWVGGLAENPEKQPVAPPLLGPVFDKVFQDQMLKLQNGDRFYYLGRIIGTNIGEEIPAQTFADIVRRNTPSQIAGRTTATFALGAPSFSFFDCSFGQAANAVGGATIFPAKAGCDPMNENQPSAGFLQHVGLDNVIVAADPANASTAAKLAAGAGDDSVLGGSGNDILLGGDGGDIIAGGAGNDILMGQGGDDLIRGNEGNDVINGSGISPAGTIIDGGVGIDFIHKGGFSGAIGSFLGEAENDFIQGSSDNDILLGGGEGSDWIEGLTGLDALAGDLGLNGGGGITLEGGNDILLGQAGNDLLSGEGGDDIFVLGDGVDAAAGGTGFNWVTYLYNLRFDNGGATASTYTDLSGFNPIANNAPLDGLIGISGIAGSSGNDIVYTSQGSDQILSGASGTTGTTVITFAGSYTTLVDGMQVAGIGIAPNAVTVGPSLITTDPVSGLSTTTVDLSVPNIGTVSGSVKFTTWPLRDTSVVTGISALLNPATKTAGWNKPNTVSGTYSELISTPTENTAGNFIQLSISDPSIQIGSTIAIATTPTPFTAVVSDYEGTLLTLTSIAGTAPTPGAVSVVITPAGQWSGGNIILGGDGNDTVYVTGGSNVIDGSSSLNVGLKAVYAVTGGGHTAGDAYLAGADRKCGGSGSNNCFSSMSLISAALDAGTIVPAGISTVHELLSTTTAGAQTLDTVVFPSAKNFYTIVAVTGGWDITGPDGNVNRLVNVDLVGFAGTAVGATAPAAQTAIPTFIQFAATNTAIVNAAYSYQFTANGAVSFTSTGTLPNGITLSASGLLSGAPLTPGTYTFNVIANNGIGGSTPVTITILVYAAGARLLSPALQTINTTVGVPVTSSLMTSNFGANLYTISPPLPIPLVIAPGTGRITGVPATTLTKTRFTISAANGVNTAIAYIDLTVDAAPVAIGGGGGGGGGAPSPLPALQLTPIIVWANPAAITTNDALTSTQLNAVAKNPSTGAIVDGTYKYFPAAGEKLPASADQTLGSTLLVTFTPSDTAAYGSTAGSAKILVKQATKDAAIVIAASSLSEAFDGNPHGVLYSSNAPSSSLSVTYGGYSNTPINAGTYSVQVRSTDPQYPGSASATLVIAKATPTVTWNPPATWNSTDPVTDALLNASSSTMGTFTYSVAAGSTFVAGTRAIKVVFDPKDSTNYNSVTVEKSLVVSAGASTTGALALVLKGKFTATTSLSAKDKAALKKAAPSKAVIITVSAYVAKGASKSADLTASRAKAAKVVTLLKKTAPKATYVIQAMGSTLNAACTAQKNECVLVNIG